MDRAPHIVRLIRIRFKKHLTGCPFAKLGAIDWKILAKLHENARITNVETRGRSSLVTITLPSQSAGARAGRFHQPPYDASGSVGG